MTKIVLVTGVSSGIGRAQARLFLENGWRVYGVDQSKEPNLTGDFHFLQQDLTLALQPIFDWCPQVDVLCNTAGVLDDYKPLLEQTAQEIQEIFEINYVTPVELTRYYLTQMLKKNSGIIINMCSIASSLAGGEPGGLADWVADETPIKRWLDPQEVADVTLFLASGKAAAMQGEILKIDGGWSLK